MKPVKRANLNLFEHEGDEEIIGEAVRSNIGIVFIVVSTALIIVLLTVLVGVVEKNQGIVIDTVGFENVNFTGAMFIFLVVMTIVILIGMMIAVYVYRRNYLVLTDQKIVMVRTYNPVSRKISQLSIGDIQDVSVEQKTLGSRVFKYGTIVVETAGEQSNLRMSLIAKPFEANRAIVQAHEVNMKEYGN